MKWYKGILIILIGAFCFSFAAFPGSIEDIKNQLKGGMGEAKKFPSKYGKGKRYQIGSVEVLPVKDFNYKDTFSNLNRDHAVHFLLKIRKLKKGEKQHVPDILKVHLYDKNEECFVTLDEYVGKTHTQNEHICKSSTNTMVRYFRDFKVNTTYHLLFLMPYNTYIKAKGFIAVIGTEGGEIIARHGGLGKIEDFTFPEETELNVP